MFLEIVSTYFYPKPYTTYGELGRIRGKYPKILSWKGKYFSAVSSFFDPEAVVTYGELDQKRGFIPKNIVQSTKFSR